MASKLTDEVPFPVALTLPRSFYSMTTYSSFVLVGVGSGILPWSRAIVVFGPLRFLLN
eukprot:m.248365 g.248365  ORF g.248365 m.248365 type:complete len:58 (+) comp58581_c0_seq1:1-174(+)